jgi:hypothetical protein
MTLQVYWGTDFTKHRGYVLFDIEYYKTKSDYTNEWYSEIKVLPCVEGITRYVYSRKDDKTFDVEEFIKDAEEIEELRRWLWEIEGNRDVTQHHKSRYKYIETMLTNFSEKYKLYVNRD